MGDTFRVAVRKFTPFEVAIRQQWDDFRAESGTTLALEAVPLDLNPLAETLFAEGGLRDGTWDVAFVVTDWLAEAVAAGALADLGPMLRSDPLIDYPDGWSPSLTGMQRFGDGVVGLPYHDGPECLVYRTDRFADPAEQRAFRARFGYDLAVPTTWPQFEDVARHFTRPEAGEWGTIFAAYPDGHNSVYDFCLHVWSRGGELERDGVPTLDTPQAVAGLDFLRRAIGDRGMTPPGQEAIDSVAAGQRFAAGGVAMMVNWFGFAAVCEQPGCAVKGRVGVAPVPAGDGAGGRRGSLNVYWLLAVAAGSRHADIATAFVRHCATPEMDLLTTMAGGIGCRRSTWDDPEVNALIPFARDLRTLHAEARTLPRSAALPSLVRIIDGAVQAAITGETPSADLLRTAQAEAAGLRL